MAQESRDFYANSVNVITGVYDVTLNFRTQTPVSVEAGEKPVLEASGICNVRMSPQHAKALAALLLKHIAQYEAEHQIKLPLPQDVQKFWDQYAEQG